MTVVSTGSFTPVHYIALEIKIPQDLAKVPEDSSAAFGEFGDAVAALAATYVGIYAIEGAEISVKPHLTVTTLSADDEFEMVVTNSVVE